ncbi:MAG TPA: 3-isopropylmalate dehydratase small subunit, partial [Clostridiales bacterium]|nr:3-isopropylmalate dehydratase small subunit [Clostridiales bacterium]
NIGLPILECADAVKECREGDQLDIDFNKGTIYNVTQGKTYQTFPFPPFLQNIIQAGGLMQAAKKTKPEGRV